MTPVVLLGDLPGLGMTRGPLARRIPINAFGDGVAGAYALAQELAPAKAMPIIALYPAWQEEQASALLRMAGPLLGGARIARIGLNLPPMALSLVADQLAGLSEEFAPGLLAGLVPRLASSVAAGAWLGSVAKFEHAASGRRAAVRSFLPGAGFLATLEPVVAVHRITPAEPVAPWPSRPLDPVWLVSAQHNGDTAWLDRHLIPSLSAQPAGPLPPQPTSPAFWGTDKFTEFVAWSGHPQAIQVLAEALTCRTCDWCGELAALPVCSFCEMAQPPLAVEPYRLDPTPPARDHAPSEFSAGSDAPTDLLPPPALPVGPQPQEPARPEPPAAPEVPVWKRGPVQSVTPLLYEIPGSAQDPAHPAAPAPLAAPAPPELPAASEGSVASGDGVVPEQAAGRGQTAGEDGPAVREGPGAPPPSFGAAAHDEGPGGFEWFAD